ncbi:hypothetical protein ACXYRO_04075 [Mycoplasma sp. 4013]
MDENESFLFARQNNKYILNEEVTAINEILNQSNLYKQIEQKALFNYNDGFKKNMQVLTFEKIISLILSNSDNLKKYKEKDKTITGLINKDIKINRKLTLYHLCIFLRWFSI